MDAGLGERIGLPDEKWVLIGPLLPAERGRGCRLAGNNQPFLEGVMWIAQTGTPRRCLPDVYGKWNSVFRRYRRWATTGVIDVMLETLAEMVERHGRADMIDSTMVRAHHRALGTERGLKRQTVPASRGVASPPSYTPAAAPGTTRSLPSRRRARRTTRRTSDHRYA